MKRSPALISLSREHHTALVWAKRIAATPPDAATLDHWVATICGPFGAALRVHFAEEEQLLPPALGPVNAALTQRLLAEHTALIALIARLDSGDRSALTEFGDLLARHVRFEEREVFPCFEATHDHAANPRSTPNSPNA